MNPLFWVFFPVAALTTLGWCGLVALSNRAARPAIPRLPPSSELGPEPPAVVDLITGDWTLCHREAASATLLDLAARRVVTIEEIGPRLSLVRLRRNVDTSILRPFELMVLEHVSALAVDGEVATEALAEGARHLDTWRKRFQREVIAEARGLGLSEARMPRRGRLRLMVAGLLPGTTVGLAAWSADPVAADSTSGGVLWALLFMFLLWGGLGAITGERGTAAGAAAAGRWLAVADHMAATGGFTERPAAAVTIWGRPMAYAAALGLTPLAVASLPVSTAASESRAWSDYGGMWHPVQVRYSPGGLSGWFWGRHWTGGLRIAPLAAAYSFIASMVILLLGTFVFRFALLNPYLLLVGAAAGAALPLGMAFLDATATVTVQGQVVRTRQIGTDVNGAKHWVALDDGTHRVACAYATDADTWGSVREGDMIRAEVGRHLGWMYRVEVRTPSRHRTHPDAVAADQSGDDAETVIREFTAEVRPDQGTEMSPAELLTPNDLGRALGLAFGRAERIPLDGSGVTGCRYHCEGAQVTVETYAVGGRAGMGLWTVGLKVARTRWRSLRKINGAGAVSPDLVAVFVRPHGGCLIRVITSHSPPGLERMSALGYAVAARINEQPQHLTGTF